MKSRFYTAPAVFLLFFFNATGWTTQESQQPAGQHTLESAELVVPPGTMIPIALSAYLNTRSSQVGDPFYADTVYPIWVQQRLVIPKGSTIKGTVTEVIRPGRFKGKGRIALRIDNILLPNGVSRNLMAVFHGIHGPGEEKIDRKTETVEMGGSKGQDAGTIVGNTGEGAIIGAIAGGGKGAGIGAGAGAAAGLATVLFSRGRDLVLDPGTQFDLELRQPLRFAYGELDFSNAELNNARRVTNPPRYPQRQANWPTTYPRRRWPIPFGVPWP
jgi:type IV secretion system protein VirB10